MLPVQAGSPTLKEERDIMTIEYTTIEEMVEIVQCLVMKGLTFEVLTSTRQIKLTGGY